jgi:hypothetical protein
MPERQIILSAAEAEGFAALKSEWDRLGAIRERLDARTKRATESLFVVRGIDAPKAQVSVDLQAEEPRAIWAEPDPKPPIASPEPEPSKEA